jgi:hypothetical protein
MKTYTTATPRTIDEQAQSLIDSEVYCCQTSLVESLIASEREGFTCDDVQNLYPSALLLSLPELEAFHKDRGLEVQQEEEESDCDYLRRLQDEFNWQIEPQEVFEWYAVSRWLAKHITAIGEPIIDNEVGQWWGRTCTGQAILLDGTFQRIIGRINA